MMTIGPDLTFQPRRQERRDLNNPTRPRPARRLCRSQPVPNVENDEREWHEHPKLQNGVSTQLLRDVHIAQFGLQSAGWLNLTAYTASGA